MLLWIVSGIIAVISLLLITLVKYSIGTTFAAFTLLVMDFIIVTSAIFTYCHFYFLVMKINKSEYSPCGKQKEKGFSLMTKKFKVPLYIVSTYIIFNFTSSILRTISNSNKSGFKLELLDRIATMLDIVGYTSDSCIYIFANRNVRTHFKSWLGKASARISSSSEDSDSQF